jgi:hypothetical protein
VGDDSRLKLLEQALFLFRKHVAERLIASLLLFAGLVEKVERGGVFERELL